MNDYVNLPDTRPRWDTINPATAADHVLANLGANHPVRLRVEKIIELTDKKINADNGRNIIIQGLYDDRNNAKAELDQLRARRANPRDPNHGISDAMIASAEAKVEKTNRILNEALGGGGIVRGVYFKVEHDGNRELAPHWRDRMLLPFKLVAPPRDVPDEPLADRAKKVTLRRERERKDKGWHLGFDADFAMLASEIDKRAKGVTGRPGGEIIFPSIGVPGVLSTDRITNRAAIPDMAALLCRYAKDAMLADLERTLTDYYRSVPVDVVGTHAEKAKELARLAREIRDAEAREVASIWQHIEAGGEEFFFDPTTPAHVILGIEKLP